MTMPPPTTIDTGTQDLINSLLAAALHAKAVHQQLQRTATAVPADQPQPAADLCAAAAALHRIQTALITAADTLTTDQRQPPPR